MAISNTLLYEELQKIKTEYSKLPVFKRILFRLFSWRLASALANLHFDASSAKHLLSVYHQAWFFKNAFAALRSIKNTLFYRLFDHFDPIAKSASKEKLPNETLIKIIDYLEPEKLLSLSKQFGGITDPQIINKLIDNLDLFEFVQTTFAAIENPDANLLKKLVLHPDLEKLQPGLNQLTKYQLNSPENLATILNSLDKQHLLKVTDHCQTTLKKLLTLEASTAKTISAIYAYFENQKDLNLTRKAFEALLNASSTQLQLLNKLILTQNITVKPEHLNDLSDERITLYSGLLKYPYSPEEMARLANTIQSLPSPSEQTQLLAQYAIRPVLFKRDEKEAFMEIIEQPKPLLRLLTFIKTIESIITPCSDQHLKHLLDFYHTLNTAEMAPSPEETSLFNLLELTQANQDVVTAETVQLLLQKTNKTIQINKLISHLPKNAPLNRALTHPQLEHLITLLMEIPAPFDIDFLNYLLQRPELDELLPLVPYVNDPAIRQCLLDETSLHLCLLLQKHFPEGLRLTAWLTPLFAKRMKIVLPKIDVDDYADVFQRLAKLPANATESFFTLSSQSWAKQPFIQTLLTRPESMTLSLWLFEKLPNVNLAELTQTVTNPSAMHELLQTLSSKEALAVETIPIIIHNQTLFDLLSLLCARNLFTSDLLPPLIQHPKQQCLLDLVKELPNADIRSLISLPTNLMNLLFQLSAEDITTLVQEPQRLNLLVYLQDRHQGSLAEKTFTQIMTSNDPPHLQTLFDWLESNNNLSYILDTNTLDQWIPIFLMLEKQFRLDPSLASQLIQTIQTIDTPESQKSRLGTWLQLLNLLHDINFCTKSTNPIDSTLTKLFDHPTPERLYLTLVYLQQSQCSEINAYEALIQFDPTIDLTEAIFILRGNDLLKNAPDNLYTVLKHVTLFTNETYLEQLKDELNSIERPITHTKQTIFDDFIAQHTSAEKKPASAMTNNPHGFWSAKPITPEKPKKSSWWHFF